MKRSKYEWYEAAVTDAHNDVRLFRRFFLEIKKTYPETYREDFAGTFKHAVEWVRCNRRNRSWAIDIDAEPLQFGTQRHLGRLNDEQKSRIQALRQDVRKGIPQPVDFITAMNFSYCIFKTRRALKNYLQGVYDSLRSDGLFLLDVMGGSQMLEESEDRTVIAATREHPRFVYYWEQKSYDGFTGLAQFAIHFQVNGSKRRLRNVFTYDWRLWTMPELVDLLKEVGFKNTHIYSEGTHRNRKGNGIYKRRGFESDCLVWIAYLIAEK